MSLNTSEAGMRHRSPNRRRLALPDRGGALLLLTASAIPIFAWSMIQVLHQLPSWLLRLPARDLLGVLAYTQMYALIETGLLFGAAVFVWLLLPTKLTHAYPAIAAGVLLLVATWAMLAHAYLDQIRSNGFGALVTFAGVAIFSLGLAAWLLFRKIQLRNFVKNICERLFPLAGLYILLGILSLFVVVYRNL